MNSDRAARRARSPYGDGFAAIAHRGGASLPGNVGKENSMLAFGHAVALGYQFLETDVRTTADGTLIVFHDAELDRVTDREGAVAELPWSEVQQARIGGTEPIPTLAELLDARARDLNSAGLNIDLKVDAAVAPLAAAIKAHQAQHAVCVGSFDEKRLNRFRRLVGPDVTTSIGQRSIATTVVSPLRPPHRFVVGDVFQVPIRHRLGPLDLSVVTARFVRRAHQLGRLVHVWTVDDVPTMHRLIDLGVDGLISDRIDLLREVLIGRGLWQGELQ